MVGTGYEDCSRRKRDRTGERVGGNTRSRARAREKRERKRERETITCVALCGLLRFAAGVADDSRRRRAGRAWPRFHSHLVAVHRFTRPARAYVERRTRICVCPHHTNETPQIALNKRVLDESFIRATHTHYARLVCTAATTPDAAAARGKRIVGGGRETWCAAAAQFVNVGRACAVGQSRGTNRRARRSRRVSEALLYRASILQHPIITTACFQSFVRTLKQTLLLSFVAQRSVNAISRMRLLSLFYTCQNKWEKNMSFSLSKLICSVRIWRIIWIFSLNVVLIWYFTYTYLIQYCGHSLILLKHKQIGYEFSYKKLS